jgi:hypothetical protein
MTRSPAARMHYRESFRYRGWRRPLSRSARQPEPPSWRLPAGPEFRAVEHRDKPGRILCKVRHRIEPLGDRRALELELDQLWIEQPKK